MSDDPFLMLSRGYFDHALWTEERVYSRAEAWLDLVRMAAWNGHKRLIGVTMIDIPRGGIVAAERFLSDRWMWSRTKVRAFIDLLESERMVTRKKDQGISVISLCNYERFNTPKNQEKTTKEPRQDHDKTKEEEDIEDKEVGGASPAARKRPVTETDDEWIAGIEAMDCYKALKIRDELGRAQKWAKTNHRQCTRRFFINWLNRSLADVRTISTPAGPTKLPSSQDLYAARQ